MQRWRVRVFALVFDEIYLYYQVVRALQTCNNIYLARQPRVPSLCSYVCSSRRMESNRRIHCKILCKPLRVSHY